MYKEKINIASYFLLIVAFIIPALIGTWIPAEEPQRQVEEIQQAPAPKSDVEAYAEIVEKGVTKVEDIANKRRERKRVEDSLFKANRGEKWVYRVGELMDEEESILELYSSFDDPENVCLFKDKKCYFFFCNNDNWNREQLEDSLDNLKTKLGVPVSLKIIDLMDYCKNPDYKLKQTGSKKFGRRRHRKEIDCYTVTK